MKYWYWLLPDIKDVLVITTVGLCEIAFVGFFVWMIAGNPV